jgi:uncharacterized protein involved in outer membrane biogenesis
MTTTGGKKGKKFLIIILVIIIALGVSVALLVKYSNQIIKTELERRLGKAFSIERIDLAWGHFEATGIKLKNTAGKEVIKVDSLYVSADFMGLLRKEYVVSSVTLKNPYIFVEVDKKGDIINPVLPVEPKPAKEKNQDQQDQPAAPITVKKIEITGGAIDYLDGKTPRTPVMTKIHDINLEVKDVHTPFTDTFSQYVLSANMPGHMSTGVVKSSGKINLKTRDLGCKTQIRALDLTDLQPYFQKDNTATIRKGFLDLDMDVNVASKKIHAPGNAVLKELEFQGGPGAGNQFLGVPLSLVVGFLKTSNNEIPVAFMIKGDLDNPKFSLQEEFVAAMTIALAGKLGFSIEGVAQSLLGGGVKGSGNVGASVKGIEQGLKKIFEK